MSNVVVPGKNYIHKFQGQISNQKGRDHKIIPYRVFQDFKKDPVPKNSYYTISNPITKKEPIRYERFHMEKNISEIPKPSKYDIEEKIREIVDEKIKEDYDLKSNERENLKKKVSYYERKINLLENQIILLKNNSINNRDV